MDPFDGQRPQSQPHSQSQTQPQQSQQQQQQQFNPQQAQAQAHFDFNSLPPAERELLLRRFQQQQQVQIQRAIQAQAQAATQNINFQRMTMNAYSTPRPPLNSTSPPSQTLHQAFINPVGLSMPIPVPMQQMQQMTFNPAQMMTRPVMSGGINPALLQQQQQQQSTGIKQINPQQFTNPLQAPLKSDPLLYTSASAPSPAPSNPVFGHLNLAPFDESVMSSEGNFIEHLIKFLDVIKFSNRTVPQIANRPISLYRLFQVVNSAGGFVAVGETKKWPLVAQALQLPAQSYEIVATVRATYYTFLYAYEQYFVQNKPLDKIDWPNKPVANTNTSPQVSQPQNFQRQSSQSSIPPQLSTQGTNQAASTLAAPSPQTNQPAVQLVPQILKHIGDTELALWKPFADVMKVPIGPVNDLDTAIIYLNSPYFTLKLEALLATQKLFAQSSQKELQSAGISAESLDNLLESLETLWTKSFQHIPVKKRPHKTMESFWSEVDKSKRNIPINEAEEDAVNRNLLICRQIASLLRTLTVTKGSDVSQFLARSDFVKLKLLPFGLMQADDWELYKDTLIILESIGAYLGTIESDFLEWNLNQCQEELKQVLDERLLSLGSKFSGSLSLDRISSFENINAARQAVSALITQSAQLWKSVPAHIFTHLSSCLGLLTSTDSISFDLNDFIIQIERFMNIFVLPTVSLLRSVRALYECQGCSIEEVRRILETVIYSPSFSLTDGGFVELCLQILAKCHGHQAESLNCMNWTGVIVLLRELREFWRHQDNASIANLGKSCYQSVNIVPGSPAKFSKSSNNSKMTLAILNGTNSITAVFSHPFLLLCKCLYLLAVNFPHLPDAIKLDLLELSVEWNLGTPTSWGREVLASDKLEESLKIIREFYE